VIHPEAKSLTGLLEPAADRRGWAMGPVELGAELGRLACLGSRADNEIAVRQNRSPISAPRQPAQIHVDIRSPLTPST
jgi:hypothetical protein